MYTKGTQTTDRSSKKMQAGARSQSAPQKPNQPQTAGVNQGRRIADIEATLSPFWAWRLTH